MEPQAPHTETIANKLSYVYIPGGKASAKHLTLLRGLPDLFVPSSISTEHGMKRGEMTIRDHHRNLAKEIIDRTGERDLCLIGHSLGGLESLDVMSELLDDDAFKSKKVNMTFVATPGFTAKGIEGLRDSYKRLGSLSNENYPYHEQHIAYPLPEAYYEKEPKVRSTLKTVFEDTPQKRADRRVFFAEALNERTLPADETKEGLLAKLASLDRKITGEEETDEPVEALMRKRSKLMFPILENFLHGGLSEEQTHLRMMEEYKETNNRLASKLISFSTAMRYFAWMGKAVYDGVSPKLAQIIARSRDRGIKVDVSFVVMERDEMIKEADIPTIQNNLHTADPGLIASFFLVEQMAHSGLGHYPQPLVDYLKMRDQENE